MRIHDDSITVSPSSITSRLECQNAHYLRYKEGHAGLPSLNFSRGKAADAGIEAYFLNRLAEPDADPLRGEFIDLAVEACAIKLANEQAEAEQEMCVKFDPEEIELWQGALAIGVPLFIREIGQYLRPVEVQTAVKVKVGEINGLPVYLSGFPDYITEGTADRPEWQIVKGGFYIQDLKTGKAKGIHVTNKIQLLCYQAALWAEQRHATTQIHKLVAYGGTKKDPDRIDCKLSVTQIPHQMDADRFEWLSNIILAETRGFIAGARSPSGITGFGCGGCSQRINCEYYDGMDL